MRIAIIILIILSSINAIGICSPIVDNREYVRYTNSRFGFSIEVPKDFISQTPTTNNDGRRFLSEDGQAEIVASAIINIMDKTLSQLRADVVQQEKSAVSFVNEGDTWFVLSWNENSHIYYQKSFVNGKVISTMTICYPIEQREKYDMIIEHLEKTFTPARFMNYTFPLN